MVWPSTAPSFFINILLVRAAMAVNSRDLLELAEAAILATSVVGDASG